MKRITCIIFIAILLQALFSFSQNKIKPFLLDISIEKRVNGSFITVVLIWIHAKTLQTFG
jgi:hypothetical protein